MPIFACGINYKTAPVSLREQIIFPPEKIPLYLEDLVQQENIQEAVVLSTCNRSEIYCQAPTREQVIAWFCKQHAIEKNTLMSHLYVHEDEVAVAHIMQVACGLDSMVLGESQILSQMKTAFSESSAAGALGASFNRLFQQVFAVAKEVRTSTAIGACPVSVSSAAVQFIMQTIQEPLSQANVLLIGAGVTVDLVLRHLKSSAPKKIFIANRSPENAKKLAHHHVADVVTLTELPRILPTIDIMISATGGTTPLVTRPMLTGRNKPLWIVDIAVPRDVEPQVAELPFIHLFSIDDLRTIMQRNAQGREHAASKAHEVIQQKSQAFMVWLRSLDMVTTTIRAYREQIEELTQTELQKAYKQLKRGADPLQVLTHFSHNITNKLLHIPSVQLRQAGYEGRLEILQLAQQLFAIPEPKIEVV